MSKVEQLFITFLLGLLVGTGTGWWVQGMRIDSIEAQAVTDKEKAVSEERDRAHQIANDYAKVVEWLNGKRRDNQVAVTKELEKPIYRDAGCTLPDSGRVLVNDAVHQANAARLGSAVLPEAPRASGELSDGRNAPVVSLGDRGVRGMLSWKSKPDQVGN